MKKAAAAPEEKRVYTGDELEDLAYNGAALPEDLSVGETLTFLMFRSLYEYARQTQMPQEQGRREKARILDQCKRYVLDDLYVKYVAELNQRTELGRREYRKAQTDADRLNAAEKLIEAIDRIPVRRPYEDE